MTDRPLRLQRVRRPVRAGRPTMRPKEARIERRIEGEALAWSIA